MTEPRELSIHQAAALLRRGKLTSEALLRSCLERIDARERDVQAWARVYGEEALQRARMLDKKAKRDTWEGPLHGIPVGVKDIFDVQDMETRCGTPAQDPAQALTRPSAPRRRAYNARVAGWRVATRAFRKDEGRGWRT